MNVILLVSVLTTTIVYSAFSTQLQIRGDAILRADKDIRITDIKAVEYNGGAIEQSNPQYSVDAKYSINTTSMFVKLPANSYVVYEITITNKSDTDYVISKIEDISGNSGLSYEDIEKIKEDVDVIDYASSSGVTQKTFTIKIENNASEEQTKNIILQYKFEEASYKAIQLKYKGIYTDCLTAQCALDELAEMAKKKGD